MGSVPRLFSRKKGEERKRQGRDLVESHNESFVDHMRRVATHRCKQKGTVDSDYLRRYADKRGITPEHPNAWGAIFRGNQWRKVRMKKSEYTTNNARLVTVWRLATDEVDDLDKLSRDELISKVRRLRRMVARLKKKVRTG